MNLRCITILEVFKNLQRFVTVYVLNTPLYATTCRRKTCEQQTVGLQQASEW